MNICIREGSVWGRGLDSGELKYCIHKADNARSRTFTDYQNILLETKYFINTGEQC